MSMQNATTTRPRRARLLALGLGLALFVAACGSASDEPAAEPRRESVTERGGPQVVRVHYTRLGDEEGESYGVEMDVTARGADQSRTKLELLVEGRVDESILFIRDGNRALLHQAEAETPYTLMEAADEYPEDLPWESSPLDPDSDLLLRVCPSPDAAGARTILGREAVGYACTWKDPGEGMDQPEKIWLDKATRMLLEYGPMKATEFVVDPEIDVKTFSTKPPAGADVDVVKATGKAPPPPDHGEDERSPEDALATIEAGSAANRIYYLGRSFNGWDLEDAEISPAGSETGDESDKSLDGDDTLYVAYGSTCGSAEDTCGAELELQIVRWNHPFAAVDKCRRQLPAVRGGAVAVETDYEVDIFTGDVAIRLEQITWEGLGKKVAAALREVGDKTAHEPLPEPTPAAMASIDARCG